MYEKPAVSRQGVIMEQSELLRILNRVKDGEIDPSDAVLMLRKEPYTDLGFARIDNHRQLRQGFAEVIYGEGKTREMIAAIVQKMHDEGTQTILITRMDREKAEYVAGTLKNCPLNYDPVSRAAIAGKKPEPSGSGFIVVASGGTSDMSVSEEAALTAEAMGCRVVRLYDVGVSGLHRLLSHIDEIMSARVIVAVAGMEGALASVIAGLANCPVLAVPTSVGYGANFHGLSALLSMLNSCASGVSVVNIDNGFGAGYQAAMICRQSDHDNN